MTNKICVRKANKWFLWSGFFTRTPRSCLGRTGVIRSTSHSWIKRKDCPIAQYCGVWVTWCRSRAWRKLRACWVMLTRMFLAGLHLPVPNKGHQEGQRRHTRILNPRSLARSATQHRWGTGTRAQVFRARNLCNPITGELHRVHFFGSLRKVLSKWGVCLFVLADLLQC